MAAFSYKFPKAIESVTSAAPGAHHFEKENH